jgi:hypothetical protein
MVTSMSRHRSAAGVVAFEGQICALGIYITFYLLLEILIKYSFDTNRRTRRLIYIRFSREV